MGDKGGGATAPGLGREVGDTGGRGVTHLLVLDLERRQAGLQLRESQRELGLDLLLRHDLGHLTGSGGQPIVSQQHGNKS